VGLIWDAPLCAAVARETAAQLDGARLEAILLDREPRNLLLFFREATLAFRLHPLEGDVALLEAREPPGQAHRCRARLREIVAPRDERLLLIQLQPPGGGAGPEGLVVELMTNQRNAIWIDVERNRIRRVLWEREVGERTLAAGARYRRPPPSDRKGIDEPLSLEAWRELLEPVEPGRRRGALLREVAFTSSLNVAALLGRGGGAAVAEDEGNGPRRPGARTDALEESYRLWRRIRAVALGEASAEPRVLHMEKRIQPYPLPLPGYEAEAHPTLVDAYREATARAGGEAPDAVLVPSEVVERLEREVTSARRKVERLREELDETPDPEPLRRTGDLILARYGEVPRGAESATLEGFEGEEVTVELDPSLPAQGNAERYYDEAARIERARERIPRLVEEARARARKLEKLLERARAGEAEPDEIQRALPERGGARKGRKEEGSGLPYRRFKSSGGLEIRVGKGAAANEDLTFHHSRPDDVWLHARQAPGAHVILRWDGEGAPPSRDLAEAAILAAVHSDARHSGTVPVDWTRRKYVRSPRKSAPGVVVPDRVRTIFVEPDAEAVSRLRWD